MIISSIEIDNFKVFNNYSISNLNNFNIIEENDSNKRITFLEFFEFVKNLAFYNLDCAVQSVDIIKDLRNIKNATKINKPIKIKITFSDKIIQKSKKKNIDIQYELVFDYKKELYIKKEEISYKIKNDEFRHKYVTRKNKNLKIENFDFKIKSIPKNVSILNWLRYLEDLIPHPCFVDKIMCKLYRFIFGIKIFDFENHKDDSDLFKQFTYMSIEKRKLMEKSMKNYVGNFESFYIDGNGISIKYHNTRNVRPYRILPIDTKKLLCYLSFCNQEPNGEEKSLLIINNLDRDTTDEWFNKLCIDFEKRSKDFQTLLTIDRLMTNR